MNSNECIMFSTCKLVAEAVAKDQVSSPSLCQPGKRGKSDNNTKFFTSITIVQVDAKVDISLFFNAGICICSESSNGPRLLIIESCIK